MKAMSSIKPDSKKSKDSETEALKVSLSKDTTYKVKHIYSHNVDILNGLGKKKPNITVAFSDELIDEIKEFLHERRISHADVYKAGLMFLMSQNGGYDFKGSGSHKTL